MHSTKKYLIFFLFIVLIVLLILIIISTTSNCEGFNHSIATITPQLGGLILANLNNKMLIVSKNAPVLKFTIDKHFIQLGGFFIDFQRIHLLNTVYLVFLRPSQKQVQHNWYFENISKDEYYMYQIIKKQKIYLNIEQDSLIGNDQKNTIFLIQTT